jgi:hypothetical protein
MTKQEVLDLFGLEDKSTLTSIFMLHNIFPQVNYNNYILYQVLSKQGFINAFTDQEVIDTSMFTYQNIVPDNIMYLLFNYTDYNNEVKEFEERNLFKNPAFMDFYDAETWVLYAMYVEAPEYLWFKQGKYSKLESIINKVPPEFQGAITKTEQAHKYAEEFYGISIPKSAEYLKLPENKLKFV